MARNNLFPGIVPSRESDHASILGRMDSRSATLGRMTLIGTLYVSQAIPVGFFVIALPAILRDSGASLETVSLFSALALAWVFKFLWAPLVDRFGSATRGHFRSWLLPIQVLAVLAVAVIATTDPRDSLLPLAVAGSLFMVVAATQDIATDGLAVRILPANERGLGNGVQVGGFYFGQILGGGLVLYLVGRIGWSAAMGVMALLMALPILAVIRFKEPALALRRPSSSFSFGALGRFFRRPGALNWVAVLVVYRAGDAAAIRMLGPLLVDHGFSLASIGLLTGVAASVGALAGALAAGLLVNTLGRRTSLFVFALFHAVALVGYLMPAGGRTEPVVLYGVVLAAAFTGGLATTAIYTSMMDRSDPASSATDFTLQQSLCAFGPLVSSILSGVVAARFGYSVLFGACVAVAVLAAGLAARRTISSSALPAAQPPGPTFP
jgi:PAT family beta-lactamase induction signal transducer AmpG